MHFAQMQAIAGVALLDARVDALIEAYGRPAIIEDAGPGAGRAAEDSSGLSANGDWRLVFTPEAHPGGRPARRDFKAQGLTLKAFKHLVIHAQGGVGRVVIRRAPLKTSYEMPADPYQSHRVVTVYADLRRPVSRADIELVYGGQYERVTDNSGATWLRYWVVQLQGQTPLRLYAVDFRLDESGERITGLAANGPRIGFVKAELVKRSRIWERNLYD